MERTLTAFSKRFNYLLDRAGFPPVGAGRAKALADRFDGSKSGAQNWIGKDLPPKRDTLRVIVSELLEEVQGNYNTNQVVAWLEHGPAVVNPFSSRAPFDVASIPIESKHTLLSRTYIAVHQLSKSMGIDIYSMDDDIMDHVYNSVIRQAVENGGSEPDKYLITSLLELASKAPIR
jgi:hypothetical protein